MYISVSTSCRVQNWQEFITKCNMVKRVSCILKIDLILPIRTKEYGSMGCGVFKQGIKKIRKVFA